MTAALLLAWPPAAVVVALLIGGAVRLADRRRTRPNHQTQAPRRVA